MGGRVPDIFLLLICDSIIREQTLAHFKLTAPGFMVKKICLSNNFMFTWKHFFCCCGKYFIKIKLGKQVDSILQVYYYPAAPPS